MFGRHVGRGADHKPRLGEFVSARGADRARDAEIGDDCMTTGQHDVLWLDVAMHDVMAVRIGQRVGDLARDLKGIIERQLRLPLQPLAEGFAFHERHHIKQQAVHDPRIVNRKNVGVL